MVFRYVVKEQQDSKIRLTDKLILCILHASKLSIKYKYPPSSIIGMDKTSRMTWCLILQLIVAESVYLKITGQEKCMVSVFLAAQADRTKLKPFVVFPAAKRESKPLDEELEFRCVVKSSVNDWMNERTNCHLG